MITLNAPIENVVSGDIIMDMNNTQYRILDIKPEQHPYNLARPCTIQKIKGVILHPPIIDYIEN